MRRPFRATCRRRTQPASLLFKILRRSGGKPWILAKGESARGNFKEPWRSSMGKLPPFRTRPTTGQDVPGPGRTFPRVTRAVSVWAEREAEKSRTASIDVITANRRDRTPPPPGYFSKRIGQRES
jgi:hypothetical protein